MPSRSSSSIRPHLSEPGRDGTTAALVDEDGRPRPNVRLHVSYSLGPSEEAGQPFSPPPLTGPDGRFRIEGLGRESLEVLGISGPKVTLKKVKVVITTTTTTKTSSSSKPWGWVLLAVVIILAVILVALLIVLLIVLLLFLFLVL